MVVKGCGGVNHNLSPTDNRFYQLASSALTGYLTVGIALDSYLLLLLEASLAILAHLAETAGGWGKS